MFQPDRRAGESMQQEVLFAGRNPNAAVTAHDGIKLSMLYARVQQFVEEACHVTYFSEGDEDTVIEYEQTFKGTLLPGSNVRQYTEVDVDWTVVADSDDQQGTHEEYWIAITEVDDEYNPLDKTEFTIEKMASGVVYLTMFRPLDGVVEAMRHEDETFLRAVAWRDATVYEAEAFYAQLSELLRCTVPQPEGSSKVI